MAGDTSLISLDTVSDGPPVVVRVSGVLDLATADEFVAALRPYLSDGVDVIADLAAVRLCDSTGLGALVNLERLAQERGCHFAIRHPRGYVARVITMTGIDRVIQVIT